MQGAGLHEEAASPRKNRGPPPAQDGETLQGWRATKTPSPKRHTGTSAHRAWRHRSFLSQPDTDPSDRALALSSLRRLVVSCPCRGPLQALRAAIAGFAGGDPDGRFRGGGHRDLDALEGGRAM